VRHRRQKEWLLIAALVVVGLLAAADAAAATPPQQQLDMQQAYESDYGQWVGRVCVALKEAHRATALSWFLKVFWPPPEKGQLLGKIVDVKAQAVKAQQQKRVSKRFNTGRR